MNRLINKIRVQDRLLTRLLISHILIASLPLFFTGKVLVDSAKDSIERTVLERNLEFTKRATQLIELKIETAKDILRSQARNQSIYELQKSNVDLAINTLVSEFDLFSQVTVFDTLGQVLATTSFEDDGLFHFSNNGLQSNVFQGIGYQSEVYLSRERLPVMDIAEPIRLYGQIVGALYAVVDLKAMWELVQQNVIGRRGEAFVFNREGVYLAHSDAKNIYSEKRFKNRAVIDEIQGGRHGQLIYETDEGVQMVGAYAPIGNYGWGFMIQQPTAEAFAQAERMRVRVVQLMLGTVLLASLLAYFYSKLIVKPVNSLVSGMDRFSRGELTHRIEKVTHDEIGALAEHFNEMADRLIEYQDTLKRTERLATLSKLASVLSHEIRNPLNSMVINMQILKRELSKQVFDRQRVEKFYEILASEIKRVDQLVKDFLLVARPQTLEKAEVALDQVLDDVVMLHAADALRKGVRIERRYARSLAVQADESKLKQVFVNLLLNAIQAMPGGGKMIIGLDAIEGWGRGPLKKPSAVVSFTDTGVGIKADDLNKIFDFYYSTKPEGTGLGLAIVQQIIDEHMGHIAVESQVNEGTTFTIYLPLGS